MLPLGGEALYRGGRAPAVRAHPNEGLPSKEPPSAYRFPPQKESFPNGCITADQN